MKRRSMVVLTATALIAVAVTSPADAGEVMSTHIGAYLKKDGYELAYSGKSHLPRPLSPKQLGFNLLGGDSRETGARACARFIKQQHRHPYYLWVD